MDWLWWVFHNIYIYQGHLVVYLKYIQFLIAHYTSLKLQKNLYIEFPHRCLAYLKFKGFFSNFFIKNSSSNYLYYFQYILMTVYSITWHKQRKQYSNIASILGNTLLLKSWGTHDFWPFRKNTGSDKFCRNP